MNTFRDTLVTLFFVVTFAGNMPAQKSQVLLNHYQNEYRNFREFIARSLTFKGDTNIDVRFYHIDIEIGINSPYVGGSVLCRFEPVIPGLNTLSLNLNGALSVDSISYPCDSFTHTGSEIAITLENSYEPGDLVDLTVYYHGIPALAGGYKGLRYEFHDENEPIIATLSTPYLAHYWYPCKDGPEDKADSVYVELTIPDTIINGISLMAVSNGLLENTIAQNGKKTFLWRHRYPIVTYYVMAAISNYVHFQEFFYGTSGESFPLDYYVFEDDLTQSQLGVEDLPEAIQLFSDKFGIYPFSNEKYGMTQLGFYGAIENQTNTITNNMYPAWFEVSVHELAHMWFGDMITCSDWHHGWLNEGFATYAEALWAEHTGGFEAYKANMSANQFWQGGTLYLQNAQDTFNIFQSIIYQKGAYVLHMLRGYIGDDDFFETLTTYSSDPDFRYGNASTEDFKAIAASISGLDLDTFFDQWIYDQYFPVYRYNYIQGSDNIFYLAIRQIQETFGYRPVFEMPVKIRLDFESGGDTVVTVWNDQQDEDYGFSLPDAVTSVAFDPDLWILRQAEYDPDLPVGLDESPAIPLVKVIPDPVRDKLIVSSFFQRSADAVLIVFDIKGRKIKSIGLNPNGETIMDIHGLQSGIYLYTIRSAGAIVISGKFICE